jgi:hypothetical protein
VIRYFATLPPVLYSGFVNSLPVSRFFTFIKIRLMFFWAIFPVGTADQVTWAETFSDASERFCAGQRGQ